MKHYKFQLLNPLPSSLLTVFLIFSLLFNRDLHAEKKFHFPDRDVSFGSLFKFQGEHFWHHGWKHHHGWKWDFKWIYLSEVTAAPSPAFITPEDTEQVFFKAKSEVKYLFFWGCMAEKNKHIAFKIKYSVDVTTTGSSDFGVPATSVAHLEKEKYLEFPADFCGCKGNKRGKHKHKGCKFKKWKHEEFFRSLTDEVELGWTGRSDNGGKGGEWVVQCQSLLKI